MEHDIGASVKKGEPLARLDDRLERGYLLAAQAKLSQIEAERDQVLAGSHPEAIRVAEADHAVAEVEMKHRELERNRLNELLDKRGVSALEHDKALFEARTSASKAESTAATLALFRNPVRTEDRRLLDAKVAAARAEVASAAAQVEQMAMSAPVDGRIIGIFLREGEAVTMTLHDPVILFAPDGPLEVRAEVDEQFFNRIAMGDPAKVFTRHDAITLPGKVREIRPVMGKKSVFSRQATERMDLQIMEVRIEFETSPSWPIGLEVDIEIEALAQPP